MKIGTMTIYAGDSVKLYFNNNTAVNKYDGSNTIGSLSTSQISSSGIYVGTFTSVPADAGDTYFFTQGNGDTDEGYVVNVTSKSEILMTEVVDGGLAVVPDSVLGRLYTIEKNQTDVLMPRLRRALGLLGEYQVADAFVYDDDGNITKCRIRIFSGQSPADSAPVWLDTDNETDPVNTAVQTSSGEIARYEINATNSLPRNLRTKFMQDFEPTQTPSDEPYGSNGSNSGTNNGSVL